MEALVDIACRLIHEVGIHNHLTIKARLRQDGRDASMNDAVQAFSAAKQMWERAEALAFDLRDQKLTEVDALLALRGTSPGFSDESYSLAWNHGMFCSMW